MAGAGSARAPAAGLTAVVAAAMAFERGLAAGEFGAVAALVPQFLALEDGHPQAAQRGCELRIFGRAGRP